MLRPIHAATAYSPQLAVGLRKIARTPTARLTVGYRVKARWIHSDGILHRAAAVGSCRAVATASRLHAINAAQAIPRATAIPPLPIGAEMLVQRMVAGGIVGEALPLAVVRRDLDRRDLLGSILDITI